MTKTWRGQVQPVLDGVDLRLGAGTVNWLSGENGAGKTTLLRVVCGLLEAETGRVQVAGHDTVEDRARCARSLGLLSAGSYGLYARLTVRQQLDYWARITFAVRSQRRETIDRTLARFGLRNLAGHRLDRISMGERQRVRLAITFLHDPVLVLLDEPRNSLDADGLAHLHSAVRDTTAAGGAVLWCSPTNDPPSHADRTLRIAAGRLDELVGGDLA